MKTKELLCCCLFLTGCVFASEPLKPEVKASTELKQVQDRMRIEFELLLDQIGASYKPAPELGQELELLHNQAQRQWAQYMDLTCKIEAFEIDEHYPAYNTAVDLCKAQMTLDRIEVIKKFIKKL